MTCEEQIASLDARIATLDAALDKAVTTGVLTSFRYGDEGTTYAPASVADIRLRIAELKTERDRLCGGGKAIFVSF